MLSVRIGALFVNIIPFGFALLGQQNSFDLFLRYIGNIYVK
jgi:hypothetical protein